MAASPRALHVALDDPQDAVARERVGAPPHEQRRFLASADAALAKVLANQHGLRPKRADALLPALAVQPNLARPLELERRRSHAGDLVRTSAGLKQEAEQQVVAPAAFAHEFIAESLDRCGAHLDLDCLDPSDVRDFLLSRVERFVNAARAALGRRRPSRA